MNRRLVLTGVTHTGNPSKDLKYSQVVEFDDRVQEIFGSTEAFIADCERRFRRSCEPDVIDVYLIREEVLSRITYNWVTVKDHRNEW